MRTTVDLEKALLERAKKLALKEGRSLSALSNHALTAYLGARKGPTNDPAFKLIVRGKPGGRFPTPAEVAAAEEDEDIASLVLTETGRRAAP
jgi:hypothetical protein